jgi:hypothetical protein
MNRVLSGSIVVMAGLVTIVIVGKRADLQCHRIESTQINCQLTSSGLLGTNSISLPAGELRGADIEESQDSEGTTYRVVLLTHSGKLPFTDIYSSGLQGKREIADQINGFVSNPAPTSLSVQQDYRWFAYPFGAIFILAGSAIAVGRESKRL